MEKCVERWQKGKERKEKNKGGMLTEDQGLPNVASEGMATSCWRCPQETLRESKGASADGLKERFRAEEEEEEEDEEEGKEGGGGSDRFWTSMPPGLSSHSCALWE